MKKFKLGLVALAIMAFAGIANAGGVGYIDYAKVIDNYDYAKQVTKEVDAKGLEMQKFLKKNCIIKHLYVKLRLIIFIILFRKKNLHQVNLSMLFVLSVSLNRFSNFWNRTLR